MNIRLFLKSRLNMAEEQIFREFLETYNRIVDECFNRCVYTFNYRYLLDDEVS
jgi:hypothetical protein